MREIAEFYFDLDNKQILQLILFLRTLIVSDECIGVIHCLNKKVKQNFEENDRKLLETYLTCSVSYKECKDGKDMIIKNRIQKEIEIVGESKTLLSKNQMENFQLLE